MKAFLKALLLVSGICLGVGIVFLAVGLVMGASVHQLLNAFQISSENLWDSPVNMETLEQLELEEMRQEGWTVSEYQKVANLEISMDAGALLMEETEGDAILVCVKDSDENIQIQQSASCLKIRQKGDSWFRRKAKAVRILLPESLIFEKVTLDLGAASVKTEGIQAEKMDAEIGAGNLEVTGYTRTKESSWKVGTGAIWLECLDSAATRMDTGVGSIEAAMYGDQDQYRLDGSVGLGKLQFGDYSGNMPGECQVDTGGEREVRAECGVGTIRITFTEE